MCGDQRGSCSVLRWGSAFDAECRVRGFGERIEGVRDFVRRLDDCRFRHTHSWL